MKIAIVVGIIGIIGFSGFTTWVLCRAAGQADDFFGSRE